MYTTVWGIVSCDVDMFTKMHVLEGYASLILLEGDKHKMRTFLVASKSFKDHIVLKQTRKVIVERLETITGKPII